MTSSAEVGVSDPAAEPAAPPKPTFTWARLLQVVGEQSGNTVVLGMPAGSEPLPIASSRERIEPHRTRPPEESE